MSGRAAAALQGVKGELRLTASLGELDDGTLKTTHESVSEALALLTQFLHTHVPVVSNPQELAERLADLGRLTRYVSEAANCFAGHPAARPRTVGAYTVLTQADIEKAALEGGFFIAPAERGKAVSASDVNGSLESPG
jgi:hypothetical protein